MTYSIRLPDGTLVQNIPDEVTPEAAKARILKARPDLAPKERSLTEAVTDIGAGAVSGLGSLVQLPGQLYGLATGNMEKTGALGLGEDIQKYGEEMKSAGLKAREAARYAVARNKCPVCGATLRRNLSITGWWQCSQYGAEGFRADSSKPACSWQGFTE